MKDDIIKGIRNLYKLKKENKSKIKKETKDDIIKIIINLFKLEKGTKPIKDDIINAFINLFEEEDDYNKPIRVDNFCSNNYIEYESNGDRNKNISIEEYLNKINPHLEDIITDF